MSWQTLEGKKTLIKCTQLTDCNDGFICCTSTNIGEWHLCKLNEVNNKFRLEVSKF